jgi:hypothetical protein
VHFECQPSTSGNKGLARTQDRRELSKIFQPPENLSGPFIAPSSQVVILGGVRGSWAPRSKDPYNFTIPSRVGAATQVLLLRVIPFPGLHDEIFVGRGQDDLVIARAGDGFVGGVA